MIPATSAVQASRRGMPVIDARGLEKAYGPRQVLAAVDLTLRSQERVGLVGRNGCGKSTLGRILSGLESADGGGIARRRDTTVEFLDQEPTAFPPDQMLRNVVLGSLDAWPGPGHGNATTPSRHRSTRGRATPPPSRGNRPERGASSSDAEAGFASARPNPSSGTWGSPTPPGSPVHILAASEDALPWHGCGSGPLL
jgi:energy-coupling factor transporter ATP-binding protein EcfA2